IFAPPFLVKAWLAAADADEDIRLPHLRRLTLAGSTVTDADFAAAAARLTPNIFVTYSCNELGTVCFADPQTRRRFPLAIGRPVGGVAWEVVDASDRPLAAGQVGQIRVRTRGMIAGYPGQPELTRHHFRDGWFYPGDLVSYAPDGVLTFHGRADDMMVCNG